LHVYYAGLRGGGQVKAAHIYRYTLKKKRPHSVCLPTFKDLFVKKTIFYYVPYIYKLSMYKRFALKHLL
jgi:hypothetical protein